MLRSVRKNVELRKGIGPSNTKRAERVKEIIYGREERVKKIRQGREKTE